MPAHMVSYDLSSDGRTMTMPNQFIDRGGRYAVDVREGDVYVSGNVDGLLYLAEILVRCAKGGYVDSFHVHIPLESGRDALNGNTEPPSELVVFAASDKTL